MNNVIQREEPEIKSAYNIHGLRKLRQQVEALEQSFRIYTKTKQPIPPALKRKLESLRTQVISLARIEARQR